MIKRVVWRFLWGSVMVLVGYAQAFAETPFLQAHTRVALGQLEQAVEVVKLNETLMTAEEMGFLMAEIYGEIGQRAKALKLLDELSPQALVDQISEKRFEYLALGGHTLELEKQLRALRQKEDFGLKYLALAALKKSGNSKFMSRLKSNALQSADFKARSDLAWVYFHLGAYAETIKVLTQSVRNAKRPDSVQDKTVLTLSYLRINEKDKACQTLDSESVQTDEPAEAKTMVSWMKVFLSCVRPSSKTVADITPKSPASSSLATESLTMKPHGAFKSDASRVSYFDRFSSRSSSPLPFPEGVGMTGASGVLLGHGQFVLTNRHVVEGGRHFAVKNALGGLSKARLIHVSDLDDLALLELEQPFPSAHAIASHEIGTAKAGGQIYSIGYPLWYLLGAETPSITNGLVSKNTGMNDDPKMFQITAKINKGNSGGPVFDGYGNLVGLTMGKLDTESLRTTEGVDPEGVNFIYHSRELMDFVGRYVGRDTTAKGLRQNWTPEEIYEKRLGAAVMVAVGR
jgi:S1-C subfamily serine protease